MTTILNPITSIPTSYTFAIYQTSPINIPSGTSVQILFPSQYLEVLDAGTYSCTVTGWPAGAALPTPTCAATGLVVTVSGLFASTLIYPGSMLTYQIVVNGVNNPLNSGTTDPLNIKFVSGSTVLININSDFNSGL